MNVYLAIRRIVDVLVSFTLMVLLLPVWLVAAVGIKLTSPGPLLFTQTRGGRFGKPFTAYKFRTMRADHVHDPTEVVPLNHRAITRFGRFLRRTKIDETPQLYNVLRGDMSIIGPRPTIMDQVVRYDAFERRRLEVPPGLTGLAQVNSNATMSWPERIKYDVYYVDHLGPALDLWIIIKTFAVLIMGEEYFSRRFEDSPYGRSVRNEHHGNNPRPDEPQP
ncbi:MAG TPA: sugar transferase [Phycisphaerae bacterium]|nr:sugar transferase [Phycisphaerae bacterium]HOJ76228.1 sugar transferase [Phycisphaerae bacterium]HOM53560.1 sugar transferase [Phycisphaerae bacterium]HON68717.1 sugar transferase [Phycisphaerae bacterium]HOQ86938.1 sugar transferase [Phycisphaerae bacterium]